jgi:hypothetical protein
MTSLFSPKHRFFKYRVALLMGIIPILIAGLTGEFFYTGPGREWFQSAFGDFVFQPFLILLIAFIWPKVDPFWTAFGVFIYNTAVEFTQLLQHPVLEALRPTVFGRLIIGSYFTWVDIVYYFAGCCLGWWWLRRIQHKILREKIESDSDVVE